MPTKPRIKSKPLAKPRSRTAKSVKHIETRPLAWLDEFEATVPATAWDNVPTDGARNLEHYLYGAPKR